MELKKLLDGIKIKAVSADMSVEVGDISIDSRTAKIGDLFICMKGTRVDSHKFVEELKDKISVFIVEEKPKIDVPYVLVENCRQAYSLISQNFFNRAFEKMRIVSIVGTNGKTSTAHIANGILSYAGFKTGLIGTLGHYILGEKVSDSLTTPDPYEVNKLFFEMYCKGVEVVIMEVSAHAIYFDKMYGIVSDISIFTNISQDHLDFFGSLENYADIKMSYFSPKNTKFAVINVDDPYGQKLANSIEVPHVTYALDNPSDVFAINVFPDIDGTSFVINLFDQVEDIKSSLFGYFNVYNLLAGIICANVLGVDSKIMIRAVRKLKAIDGRFNVLKNNKGLIVIDYAHTPDGFQNLLTTARTITKSRIITVFGCGGERDKAKRAIMGTVASKLSEVVVLTTDNPRSEKPEEIIKDIEKGVLPSCEKKVCVNRSEAISYAIGQMQEGDTVVIAGKGAETFIEIGGKKLPFSDFDQVYKRGARK